MKLPIKIAALLVLMLLSALTAWALRPTMSLANQRPKVDLEQLVPRQFGHWHELQLSSGQIINPQQAALLQKLYTQTLSRTYINQSGSIVMLSIAYGVNQSDGLALHYPEVCYPAQGFQVQTPHLAEIETTLGRIRVTRLLTTLSNRHEPVTYWATIGNKIVTAGLQTKLAQLEYGFKGQIPDGMIIRVSTIDSESTRSFALQDSFVSDLAIALSPEIRLQLMGLND